MKVKLQHECILTLSEPETKWLRGVMQNAFCENESEEDADMRRMFWVALGGDEDLLTNAHPGLEYELQRSKGK